MRLRQSLTILLLAMLASACTPRVELAVPNEPINIAKQNGISVSDVEAIAGKKAIEKTPSGQIIQLNGNWVRK